MSTTKQEYTPKMLKITNLNISLDKFKEKIANRVGVAESGKDLYVFNSSKYQQEHVMEMFPDAKIEVVDSDNSIYQQSLKIQSQLNWTKFKTLNASHVSKSTNEVFVVIKSSPFESRSPELASAFARKIASIAYKQQDTHDIKFIVRPWLKEVFAALKEDDTFVDSAKKPIKNYNFYLNRTPMTKAMDKVIQVKLIVTVAMVEKIVNGIASFERFPNATFIEPSRLQEITDARKKTERKNRIQNRNEKRAATKPSQAMDKPTAKTTKTTERPAKITKTTERPAKITKTTERPANTTEKPTRGPKTTERAAAVKFDLQNIPTELDLNKLSESISSSVNFQVKITKTTKGILCSSDAKNEKALVEVLTRLKVNGEQIIHKKISQ
ncbi:hypothetical protein SS50377_20860 [Spironucleus salmonicida]|uniref:Uncharacterized protein n=2 Tax=Spironucleus salmonicida TaxID=348837 RepID=A0A9P8S294_9EUKA|nr:hypothetical protein SS50377_20858 [Spironucleus salmonicida]KAH0577506.1 hypothetical protein SS50377_20860 [Spironucleus salmonicida]